MLAIHCRRSRAPLPALVSALVALAAGPTLHAQDPFEPNDTCNTAAPLPLGLTTGLTLGPTPDDDWYTITVPADAWIEAAAASGGGHLDVELWELDCTTLLASSVAAPLRYADCSGAARDLVLRVVAGPAVDVPYELDVAASSLVDDTFEPNDSCAASGPSVIRDYMIPGLVVTRCNEDWWAISVQPNQYEVQIDAIYDPADGSLDLELYDDTCTLMLASTTTAHGKALRYVNTATTVAVIRARIAVTPGSQRVPYGLATCFGGGTFTPLIGYQACIGTTNSTGRPAGICAFGSDVAQDDDVNLYVGDLPANAFGYFIASQTYSFTALPGNSLGNLCLGTPGRYSYDIRNSGPGFIPYEPALAQTPVAGGGFTAVQAGQRWYWQLWHRDSVGGVAESNFSGALYIDFQ